ncbi:MAG: GGDEF domain-containing protein [Peptococcaceae bacterium]
MSFLDNRSKGFYMIWGIMQIAFVAVIDFCIGEKIVFSYFYFVPISLVTWYVNENNGLLMSVLSGISWTIVELILVPGNFYTGNFYINSALRFCFLIIIVLALSVLKSTLDSEKSFARRDPLTGVANRRAFYEITEKEIERSRRNKHALALAYLDLDDFKAVNDILGHETGDQVLFSVGNIIINNIRKSDTVARLGGDEFAILMPETKAEQAKVVIERIREDLLRAMKKNVWFVTFTIGVICYDTPPLSVEEGIKAADGVMYRAKESGKNMIKFESKS